ncbi:MAG: prepilin-type N-terminal cleavage/methylation domain-containing protein [Candidatus Competibacteraceae bacterium]|nr:prepilin-type N-terminal cleavage/methylation domain-containing protein [Candidatus Competibacteraceae bacterium]
MLQTHRSSGFSLVELLVVLVILVLVIAVVPPLFMGVGSTAELRGAARQLAAGLRSARSNAVLKQNEATLTVDLEARHFRVSGDNRSISLPGDVAVKLYTAQSELLNESSGSIRFFPDGSSTGGHITLANGRIEYTVNVDWLTGRIGIDEQSAQR